MSDVKRSPVKLDIVAKQQIRNMGKFSVRRSPGPVEDSFVAVTLTYRADPDKDKLEWILRQAAKMPDHRAFRREYLLDWTSAEGLAFYPDFAEQPERFVSYVTYNPDEPVLRGYDFGFRHPAAVWVQRQPDGRLGVLFDLLPENIDTYSFRDLVLFLSGQTLRPGGAYDLGRELDHLASRPAAYASAQRLLKEKPWWGPAGEFRDYPIPICPPGARFHDYSGPEAYQVRATVESNKRERTDAEVFESGGIYLDVAYQSVEAGETLVRKLLLAHNGAPGIVIHPGATNLINGLGGGLVYATSTPANPRPDTVRKDGFFEHVHDAFRYLVTHAVEADDPLLTRIEPQHFRETAELKEAVEGLDEENRDQNAWEHNIDFGDLDSFC